MSSDLFPTVKSKKHAIVSVSGDVMREMRREMVRDQRGFSFVVSRALEAHYEEKIRLKND